MKTAYLNHLSLILLSATLLSGPVPAQAETIGLQAAQQRKAERACARALRLDTPAALRAFLARYPNADTACNTLAFSGGSAGGGVGGEGGGGHDAGGGGQGGGQGGGSQGNNGVGNGQDGPPGGKAGNDNGNDGPGTGPGSPGNQGGNGGQGGQGGQGGPSR